MPYPRQLQRTFGLQLTEGRIATTGGGAGDAAIPATGSVDLTDEVASYTLPSPERARERHSIGGGKAAIGVPFGFQEMTFEIAFKGHVAEVESLLNRDATFIVTENLFTPVAGAAAVKDTSVHTIAGEVIAVVRGQYTNAADQRNASDMTLRMEVNSYHSKHSNLANPSWDIDIQAGTYKLNNVDVF